MPSIPHRFGKKKMYKIIGLNFNQSCLFTLTVHCIHFNETLKHSEFLYSLVSIQNDEIHENEDAAQSVEQLGEFPKVPQFSV